MKILQQIKFTSFIGEDDEGNPFTMDIDGMLLGLVDLPTFIKKELDLQKTRKNHAAATTASRK